MSGLENGGGLSQQLGGYIGKLGKVKEDCLVTANHLLDKKKQTRTITGKKS